MAVNQVAIDHLRLDEAFACNVHCPFSDCWTVRMDSELLLVDDDDKKVSRFSDDEGEKPKALAIINKANKQIVLLSIDHKLFDSHKGGIADCALFDEQQFHFVEFKTNAYGNSVEGIRANFEKAIDQLEETLKVFKNRLRVVGVCFEDAIDLSCHIVTSSSFPRSQALKQEYAIRFGEENDGLGLSFSNKLYW